jgi:hypothetical protein
MKVKVYHAGYGCDTGCCGHVIEVDGDGVSHQRFEFTHPYDENTAEEKKAWARELAEETIKQNWPECLPKIDWSTLEVEASQD